MTIISKLINFIKINGITHQVTSDKPQIVVKNNKVIVDDVVLHDIKEIDLKIEFTGNLANLDVHQGSVVCGDVGGDVSSGGSVECVNVGGSVEATDGVVCSGSVGGNVDSEGDITCGDVGEYADAGGDITCGNVGEYVTSGGDVTCGNVGGNVEADGGDVTCDDVSGDINNADTVSVRRS